MARTDAGATLTEQHRQGQLRIRSRALRDFARLWPIWQGDAESFDRLTDAAFLLVSAYRGMSGSLAGAYFEAFRLVERAGGSASVRPAPELDRRLVIGTLNMVGRDAVREALLAGRSPADAMRAAFVRSSGSVTRQVLNAGRDTIISSVAGDRRARGWARVTDGNPCAFCAMLAGRGAVYSENTADFQAHDHCGCSATAVYAGDPLPSNRAFKEQYDAAIRQARADGTLRRGTSNDSLNAFRRFRDSAD